MEIETLLAFLVLVALGSYVQTVSGFAIALIIAGGATALALAPIPFTANVISFVALANTATAVHSRHSHIDLKILLHTSLGVLLLSGVGLLLLDYLNRSTVDLLEILLGIVILASGALLTIHPHQLNKPSSTTHHLIAGGLGGLLSGLFGVGGPPLIVHIYRQPISFPTARTTMLAVLGVMTAIRILFETFNGNIDAAVVKLSLMSIPISIVTTLLARRYPPPISDGVIQRFAFALLCIIGASLIIKQSSW